jgi:PIN domain nuclease of toxin-antitoxin system
VGCGGALTLSCLLDTHVLLWWLAGGQRLSRAAAAAIEGADSVLLSPLTFWEAATLLRLGRVELDRELSVWVQDVLRQPRITLAPLSAEAAAWAGNLGQDFPGDPIDRLLYATSRDLRVPLISKDDGLRAFAAATGEVEVIW